MIRLNVFFEKKEGIKAEDVIARLKGIECGSKGTSCPDQLALFK